MKHDVYVTYSQLAVFDETLAEPFNDWRSSHVDQGFAWRPKSVSFGTLLDGGEAHVHVRATKHFSPSAAATRCIRVPFEVPPHGGVELGSISSSCRVKLPPGKFSLHFETWVCGHDEMECVLTFVPDEDPQPAVLLADAGLSVPQEFDMDADPA